ncbi:hypothetical protein [Terasakiispira papahanaumokuakeensis]|nr:hypothetical protein [Terasakiispira papahanaumokuakeensis]
MIKGFDHIGHGQMLLKRVQILSGLIAQTLMLLIALCAAMGVKADPLAGDIALPESLAQLRAAILRHHPEAQVGIHTLLRQGRQEPILLIRLPNTTDDTAFRLVNSTEFMARDLPTEARIQLIFNAQHLGLPGETLTVDISSLVPEFIAEQYLPLMLEHPHLAMALPHIRRTLPATADILLGQGWLAHDSGQLMVDAFGQRKGLLPPSPLMLKATTYLEVLMGNGHHLRFYPTTDGIRKVSVDAKGQEHLEATMTTDQLLSWHQSEP